MGTEGMVPLNLTGHAEGRECYWRIVSNLLNEVYWMAGKSSTKIDGKCWEVT